MKIINANVEFITPVDGAAILKRLNSVDGFAISLKPRSPTPAPRLLWPVSSSGGMKRCWNTVPSR